MTWKKLMRGFIVMLLAFCAVVGAEAAREEFAPLSDLTAFNPEEVGKLDAEMWRSYYERRPVALFSQMISLLCTQYGMPPLEAVRNAYRAAHAAFVFKDGRNRAEYMKALPDLDAYYADIDARAMRKFDAHGAAQLELEWWIVHREKMAQLPKALAELESAIYQLPPELFAEYARLRTDAMILRDAKGDHITDADWAQIGDLLDRSWKSLHGAVASHHLGSFLPQLRDDQAEPLAALVSQDESGLRQ